MASLAIPLGGLLKSMPPLRAYTWDIAGSLAGIAAFTLLSALGTRPDRVVHSCSACCSCSGGFAAGITARIADHRGDVRRDDPRARRRCDRRPGQLWSPYYRIDVYEAGGETTST